MKNLTALLLTLFITFPFPIMADIGANAINSVGWNDLTPAQQAEALQNIAKTVEQNAKAANALQSAALTDPKKLNEWVDLGQHVGQALGGAAKELGVQASEFAQTPVGNLTVALIVWHFLGNMLMHLFGGIFVLVIGMLLIWWHSRYNREVEITYDPTARDSFGRARISSITKSKIHEDWAVAYYVMGFITILVSLITIFTFS